MNPPRGSSLIVAACGVAACSTQPGSSQVGGAEPTAQRPEVVDVPAVAQPNTSAGAGASSATAAGAVELPGAESARATAALRALFGLPAWARLRRGWRALDAVELHDDGPGPAPLPPEVQREVAEMEEALDELASTVEARQLDPALLSTLRSVVATRGAVLSGLRGRLMVLHRMPSPGELAVARVGGALEQRIDALALLRSTIGTGNDAYRAALGAVQQRLLLLVALDGARGTWSMRPVPKGETLEEVARALRERRDAVGVDGGTEGLDDLDRAVGEARRLAPALGAMVADLEQ